ncbi:reverse transcriptase domain-containing protein [uncultured Enterovirga sp.]|uniref:RNA-directed DNA polymerase n=1 Tax=uncultured Enterovirga sp. TaxID=2026352 RepID=UPI0035CA1954
MPGLDRRIIAQIDHESVIAHVKADIRSDFILAPHYNAILNRAGGELWDQLKQQLRAGTYQPELPITMSVPKERFFTRPGSILQPADRFMYQALVDSVMEQLEESHDRSRSFSHVPSDEEGQMFEPNHESWEHFQARVAEVCRVSEFILKADISNYFERLPQHNLVNLMSAAGCPPEVVSLLEEMLLAFRERNSFGIVQGVYPSDALGNFYLSALDAHCELDEVLSARYVDDIYIGFASEAGARKGLAGLIETLRKDGLHLNEYKSRIMPADEVIREETAIDRLFEEIRGEVADDESYARASPYGFEVEWEDESDEEDEDREDDEDLQNAAVERLIENIDHYPTQADQIEKFCLPILRSAQSDSAVEHVLENLKEKPHQTRLYFSYISKFVRTNQDVVESLEALVRRYCIRLPADVSACRAYQGKDGEPGYGEHSPPMASEPYCRERDTRHGCLICRKARRRAAEADSAHLLRGRALRLCSERDPVLFEVFDRHGKKDLQAGLGRAQRDQHADRSDHLTRKPCHPAGNCSWSAPSQTLPSGPTGKEGLECEVKRSNPRGPANV